MEVLLLGTGGPLGWPQAGCTCASCGTAAARGIRRAPACALVDDVLLLDGNPALTQTGHRLDAVEIVLLTGAQDHAHGWLDAVGGRDGVTLMGPLAALEPYRVLGDQVRLVPASPGHRHTASTGHELQAVGHGSGLAWDVLGPEGTRLLYAPGTGLLHGDGSHEGAPYGLVLAGLGGRSPAGLPTTLASLRRGGLVTTATDVRAVGHDHHDPMPDVLRHQLAAWDVRDVHDGARIQVGQGAAGRSSPAGRTLVLGGARSGKSFLAEQLVAAHAEVTYVATGGDRSGDSEWQQRVSAHRERRPASWRTVETTDLTTCIRDATGAVLIDCLGTWLTALLDRHGVWDGAPLAPVEDEVQEVLAAWRASRRPLVAVSNEVGSGVVPATASGRLFRDLLGRINAQVAAESETVLLTVAGIPIPLRVLEQTRR